MGSDPMIKKPHQPNSQPHQQSRPRAGSSRDAALRAAERDTRSLTGQTPTATTSPADVAPAPAETVSSSEAAVPQPASHPAPAQPVKSRPSQAAKPAKSACRKLFCALCLVLALVLLSAGGIAIWYFGFHHQPEQAVLDAFDQLGRADGIALQGDAEVSSLTDPAQTIATLDFVAAPEAPGMLSADLTFFPTASPDGTASTAPNLQLQLNTVTDDAGVTYLQLGGLTELLANVPTTELSPEELTLLENYRATLETIDNEWWQISVTDLIDSLELEPTASQAFHEFYGCLWDLAQTNYRALFAALYQQHPFLQISERTTESETSLTATAGSTVYVATIDFDQLAAFLNQIPTTDAAEAYFACYNNISGLEEALDATDFNELTADELRESLPGNLTVELEISNWSHQLRQFSLNWQPNDQLQVAVTARVAYQSAIVTIPDAYRPLTDLVDELSEFIVVTISPSNDPTLSDPLYSDPLYDSSDLLITEEIYEPVY